MALKETIVERLKESVDVKTALLQDDASLAWIEMVSRVTVEAFRKGNKVFFAGNGGSFSDSLHLAAEFVSRFTMEREALPAIALGANNSIITAVGNDYAYFEIFRREVNALGNRGDILLGLSTSGNSSNVLAAIEAARDRGLAVYGMTGADGGQLGRICPCLKVPSKVTARIQEAHIAVGHIYCELVEKEMFG